MLRGYCFQQNITIDEELEFRAYIMGENLLHVVADDGGGYSFDTLVSDIGDIPGNADDENKY